MKNRKWLALLLGIMMVLSFGLTACGDMGAPVCTHEYQKSTYIEATCISRGVNKEECKLCGKINLEKTQKAMHEYENGVCTTCGAIDEAYDGTIILPPDDPTLDYGTCEHTEMNVQTNPATCASVGLKTETCYACGKMTVLEVYPIKTEHTLQEVVEAPSCLKDGCKISICSVCVKICDVQVLKKLGHNMVNGSCTRCEVQEGPEIKTINVRALKASWGENWINELVEKFEAAYEHKGWKVNVLKPTADIRNDVVIQELSQGYEETQIDMYITAGTTSQQVGAENTEYGVLCEDIGYIWDLPAIDFDGNEESKTLREKVVRGQDALSYDIYDKCYSLPYIAMTGGMVVNVDKLSFYGYTAEDLPKTTNELFEMWDVIYTGYKNGVKVYDNSIKSDLYPFTYIPGTANAYTLDWVSATMAQYDEEQFQEWRGWQTKTETGYDWFQGDVAKTVESDMVLETLTVLAQAFDTNLASRGTAGQSLDQAQSQIMKKSTGAIFMCNGSWYLNDMAIGYKNSLDKITIINFPVISAIADKLWADTVSDEAKREEMLRYAIDQVDDVTKAGDTAAIAADMSSHFNTTVTEDDVKDIRRARGVYSDRTTNGSNMIMTKGLPADKKEICEHFMRFIASDDAAEVMAETANATSAYMQTKNTHSQYKFVQDASTFMVNKYASPASNDAVGYRLALGRNGNFCKNPHITSHIATRSDFKSIYNGKGGYSSNNVSVYRELAEKIQAEEIAYVEAQLAGWEDNNQERIAFYTQIYTNKSITIE